MDVVFGLVMACQFGTNWSGFSEFASSVTGLLLGLIRVGRGLHFLATCMVALGTFISISSILASNSSMHTCQGRSSSMAWWCRRLGLWSLLNRRAGRIFSSRPFLRTALWTCLAPASALCCGWCGPGRHRTPERPLPHLHPRQQRTDYLGGLVAAAKPSLRPGRHLVHPAVHPRLYGMVVLRLSRQGQNGRGLPLKARRRLGRVARLVAI